MKAVSIWTDGSCSNNPGPGGFAAILQCGEHTREITGGEPSTTNNRMELRAIVAGLEAIKAAAEITIYADSLYAIGAFTGNKINKNADLITAGLLKIRSDQEHGRDRDLPARERPCRRSPQRTVRQARPRPNHHRERIIRHSRYSIDRDSIAETTQPITYATCRPSTPSAARHACSPTSSALPAEHRRQVWLQTHSAPRISASRACDLLDPILPCFVRDPDTPHILDKTRAHQALRRPHRPIQATCRQSGHPFEGRPQENADHTSARSARPIVTTSSRSAERVQPTSTTSHEGDSHHVPEDRSSSDNVGRDAEMRYTPAGVPVADFTLATNRRWTNTNGDPQEKPPGSRSSAGANWPKSPRSTSARASSSSSRAMSTPPPSSARTVNRTPPWK